MVKKASAREFARASRWVSSNDNAFVRRVRELVELLELSESAPRLLGKALKILLAFSQRTTVIFKDLARIFPNSIPLSSFHNAFRNARVPSDLDGRSTGCRPCFFPDAHRLQSRRRGFIIVFHFEPGVIFRFNDHQHGGSFHALFARSIGGNHCVHGIHGNGGSRGNLDDPDNRGQYGNRGHHE